MIGKAIAVTLAALFSMASTGNETIGVEAGSGEVALVSDDGWALVTGLERRLGGPFIIAGLAGLDAICNGSGACVTGRQVGDELQAEASTTSVAEFVETARIGDRSPVSFVAVRAKRSIGPRRTVLRLDIFDASAGTWSTKQAILDDQRWGLTPESTRRALRRLTNV
ncbi:hypothetical protein [Sphingomonas baiyangensis]|uniref:Uncharacterized protein n=1 Tax=Sphingomonas baiyangensis TaxID=2572576 RepID=A0A4U1L311_9SPHN|nr:hypothetical protein [Sphingomonas baiyangensis]TKD50610.1 hypothetical protein FBR43_07400 [Sphingomonas baiyangensis]